MKEERQDGTGRGHWGLDLWASKMSTYRYAELLGMTRLYCQNPEPSWRFILLTSGL